jgi:mRNA interferase MazF
VVGIVVSSNTRLLDAPGNVLLPAKETGLPRDSVANVTQLVTVDRDYLEQRAGRVSPRTLARVEVGIRLVLDL